jgi:predicted TIM-barrel fold metal-dependent hydrolase
VIDDHVHPFPLAFEPLDLAGFTLDVAEGEEAERTRRTIEPTRLATEALRVRLAAHLGCEVGDVIAVRDTVARADWRTYVRGLFADADTNGMLMDAGWKGLPPGGAEDFAELSGAPVWELARLEPVIDRHISKGCGVDEVIDAVDAFMEQAARDGAVGFKTVLAYRTGLAVDVDVTRPRAERELGSDRAAGLPVRRTGKSLRDLLFLRVLERCADLQRPLQVHTGIGDSEIRLAESDPLLLEEALRTSAASATDVVLIHGSFPWHEQAGYLASVHPRLWTEISLCNLFSPTTTADRLLRILDIAPAGRITVGSDGHGIPESHWFGSVVVRDAWEEVRHRLRGSVRESWLDEAREHLFERNARDLYGLPAADQVASSPAS